MIEKIIQHIEMMEISVTDWVVSFIGIIFIRFLLESIAISDPSGFFASDAQTLVHYGLFYFTATIGSMVILQFFTHKGRVLGNFMLFFLTFMWIAPIIDFIAEKITGLSFSYAYISDGGYLLVRDFFTFFGPHILHGATVGIRVELIIILCGITWFVWHETKNFWKTVAGFVSLYSFIFVLFALPGILFTISHIGSNVNIDGGQYIIQLISTSNLASNSVQAGLVPHSYELLLEIEFDKFMSQLFFILSCVFLFVWFWQTERKKFVAVLKNCRPERVGSYLMLICLGMWYAYLLGVGQITSWVDVLGILCMLIAWFSAWLFAVHVNDCEDQKIDEISNTNRPLTQHVLTKKDMHQSGIIWLCMALLGAWCAGYYPFYMVCVYIASSYIYSAQPLRLKRVPVVSVFLMSVMALTSVLAGFFFLSQNKIFYTFPTLAMVGILIIHTLIFNIKDLKDIEGDRADGIWTIPVLVGEKKAFIVCGSLLALSYLLVPIFFSHPSLYIIAIPASIASYFATIRKPYKEKYLFMIYFAFIVCGLILFIPS